MEESRLLSSTIGACSSNRTRSSCTSRRARRFCPPIFSSAPKWRQWLFFEQYSHEPYIASVRYLVIHPQVQDPRRAIIDMMRQRGYDALGVMERHLRSREWFVGARYSIADIALYAYTHVADEGGFDLSPYPSIRAWLGRVKSQPMHIPITQS
jgi:glutathione S-transferase